MDGAPHPPSEQVLVTVEMSRELLTFPPFAPLFPSFGLRNPKGHVSVGNVSSKEYRRGNATTDK